MGQKKCIVLTCSLNGSFSFQTLYPILAGNILLTDPLSQSSWIFDIIHSSKSCFTYRTRSECMSILSDLPSKDNKEYSQLMKDAEETSKRISSILLSKQEVLDAYRNIEDNLDALNNLTTTQSRELTNLLKAIKTSLGNQALNKIIELFEYLQEMHRTYWNLIIISSAEERLAIEDNLIDQYISHLPRILPRAILMTEGEYKQYKPKKERRFECFAVKLDLLLKNI